MEVDPALADAVKTVDSFQGKEADLVVVSLVRDSVRASWDWPLKQHRAPCGRQPGQRDAQPGPRPARADRQLRPLR